MNIALFGGTFNPIHCGHLSAARAAREALALDLICFIPSGRPPHRSREVLIPYEHRFAMVALACAGEPGFIASNVEAPGRAGKTYSVVTVRGFRKHIGRRDRLFFIIGADAFLELRTWYQWRQLLGLTDFVVVSRAGVELSQVEDVLPAGEVLQRRNLPGRWPLRELRMKKTSVWVLGGVWVPVSATDIRHRVTGGRELLGLVPPAVDDYIRKQGLYR